MPMLDLTPEEYDAIVHLLQKAIRESATPWSRQMAPIRSALEKFATKVEIKPALRPKLIKFRRASNPPPK